MDSHTRTSSGRAALDPVMVELVALRNMSLPELAARYQDVVGPLPPVLNATQLRRKIAWRLQEREGGGLSDSARESIANLSRLSDAARRLEPSLPPSPSIRDPRLPVPGSVITRPWGGEDHTVTIGANDIEYRGKRYRSLSAVARAITGQAWNGYLFFGLDKRKAAKHEP